MLGHSLYSLEIERLTWNRCKRVSDAKDDARVRTGDVVVVYQETSAIAAATLNNQI